MSALSPLGLWCLRHPEVRNAAIAETCSVTEISVTNWRVGRRHPSLHHQRAIENYTRRHAPRDVVTPDQWDAFADARDSEAA